MCNVTLSTHAQLCTTAASNSHRIKNSLCKDGSTMGRYKFVDWLLILNSLMFLSCHCLLVRSFSVLLNIYFFKIIPSTKSTSRPRQSFAYFRLWNYMHWIKVIKLSIYEYIIYWFAVAFFGLSPRDANLK